MLLIKIIFFLKTTLKFYELYFNQLFITIYIYLPFKQFDLMTHLIPISHLQIWINLYSTDINKIIFIQLLQYFAIRITEKTQWIEFSLESFFIHWAPKFLKTSIIQQTRRKQFAITAIHIVATRPILLEFSMLYECEQQIYDLCLFWSKLFISTITRNYFLTTRIIDNLRITQNTYYMYFMQLIKLSEFLFNRPVCCEFAHIEFAHLYSTNASLYIILHELFNEIILRRVIGLHNLFFSKNWFWMFVISFYYRDLNIYHRCCQLLANLIYQPEHGHLFLSIFFFSQLLFQIFQVDFTLYGLTIKLTGKIGVRGISRTRSLRSRCGKTSFTITSTNRVKYLFDIINADGGVLGLKILLLYT